jgi:hypothetical protein
MENDMKKTTIIAAFALALPGIAQAADTPAPQKECCCKMGEDGKMACCKDKDAKPSEPDHEGHDMKDMSH